MSQALQTWVELQSETDPNITSSYRVDRDNEKEAWVIFYHDTSYGEWKEGIQVMSADDSFFGTPEKSFSVIMKMLYSVSDGMTSHGWKLVNA